MDIYIFEILKAYIEHAHDATFIPAACGEFIRERIKTHIGLITRAVKHAQGKNKEAEATMANTNACGGGFAKRYNKRVLHHHFGGSPEDEVKRILRQDQEKDLKKHAVDAGIEYDVMLEIVTNDHLKTKHLLINGMGCPEEKRIYTTVYYNGDFNRIAPTYQVHLESRCDPAMLSDENQRKTFTSVFGDLLRMARICFLPSGVTDFVKDLCKQIIDATSDSTNRIVVIGHSYGGSVVSRVAIELSKQLNRNQINDDQLKRIALFTVGSIYVPKESKVKGVRIQHLMFPNDIALVCNGLKKPKKATLKNTVEQTLNTVEEVKKTLNTSEYVIWLPDPGSGRWRQHGAYGDWKKPLYKTFFPLAWIPLPRKAAQGGGGIRKPSMKTMKKTHGKNPACKWIRTTRKVHVKKSSDTRTVYRNMATGELRIRKMVARPDGTRRVSYIKF
jgi:mannose/fructose-specific phosphotransferase system component IIA